MRIHFFLYLCSKLNVMTRFIYLLTLVQLLFLAACTTTPPIVLHWEMSKNDVEPGVCEAYLTITNTSDDTLASDGWILYFNLMSLHPLYAEGDPLQETEIQASWHSIAPTVYFSPMAPGDSHTFLMRYRGSAIRQSSHPEGFFLIQHPIGKRNSSPISIPCTYAPYTRPEQMKRGIPTWEKTPYADGEYVYKYVEKVTAKSDTVSYILPIFPQPKHISLAEGTCDVHRAVVLETLNTALNQEGYQLCISPDTVYISAKDEAGFFYARQTLNQLSTFMQDPSHMPCMTIEDYPDLHYRSLMLDVVRNYYPVDSIYTILDIMAQYKLNVLHFHLSDDEAWRLEIPGLPQLTDIGSRRGYTTDETDCLLPMYCGGWDPSAPTTANGYITREKFIELLRYARERNIRVIPEIDMPGHMRAAKKAMGNLLTDSLFDARIYLSAQNYTDNVINVSLPYAVQFIDHVVTEIVQMYREAGCELNHFNIGGDEVPKGALTKEEHQNFIDSVVAILQRYHLQPIGWEEIDHFCQPNTGATCYAWLNSETKPIQLAEAGYQVVIATANHLYFDFAYCNHHEEKGLNWGGYTDEYRAFDWLPAQHPNIVGMSAQLWGEVIRSFAQVEWQLYPKIFGLVERAWNNRSQLALADYNHLVYDVHLPYFASTNRNFHIQQPGITICDNLLIMNKVMQEGEILYCFDDGAWQLYKGPVASPKTVKVVKAKVIYLDKESNTTWLWN